MTSTELKKKLISAGKILSDIINQSFTIKKTEEEFFRLCRITSLKNPWFTYDNIIHSVKNIINDLSENNIDSIMNLLESTSPGKKVAVILSGDFPVYGFSEMLCIQLSGNIFVGKQTTEDNQLLEFIAGLIWNDEPENDKTEFTSNQLTNFDAVIAYEKKIKSGSFHKYFRPYPRLLLPQKYSTLILNGDESEDTIRKTGNDIFMYFGRTSYNIKKLLVPGNYDFQFFLNQLTDFNAIIDHSRYANQYEYYKSVCLLNQTTHLDNGFLLLTEENKNTAPVGCLHYSYYTNDDYLNDLIHQNGEKIESIISKRTINDNTISPGNATLKNPVDRTEVQDIIKFLNNL